MFTDRNREIYRRYVLGENCRLIGIDFGLTKTRVIQIAKSLGAQPRVYEPSDGEVGWNVCKVDGCGCIVRSRWSMLCNTHYFRGRRTGSTNDPVKKAPALTNHGYLASHNKAHPASSKSGVLYEHRKVFYETHGPDGHKCFWCGKDLLWGGTGQGKLCVDHINGNKEDNSVDNLKASCYRCNVNRGLFMSWLFQHKDDPIIREIFNRSQP